MIKKTLGVLAVALLAGCAGTQGDWKYTPAGGYQVGIISIEIPEFCIRAVETHSDVALIRPDYQTVVTQACSKWDGMGNSPVVWILVEDASAVAASVEGRLRQIEQTAIQNFKSGSHAIASPTKTLKDFLEVAKASPDAPIRIVGHTDSRGNQSGNAKAGLKRAQAVAKWLETNGIDRRRIEVASAGEKEPIKNNGTAQGRAENRRAEAVISLIVTGGE